MRKSLVGLFLLSALSLPLTLSAATLPQGTLAPAAVTACPQTSAVTAGDLFQTLAQTAPAATPETIYQIGRCSGSCNPATCHHGPLGLCQAVTCYIGVPSTCPTGQTCIRTCDDLY